jgi:hypothetical protein
VKTIHVTIEGISPLLMHRFTDGTEIAVQNGHRPAHRGEKGSPREQAEQAAYRDAKTGELYIPGPALFSALVSAGRFHKLGKNKMTTNATSLVPAGLIVPDLVVPLGVKEYEVDSRRVVNQATRGAHVSHRPRLDAWRAKFTLELDDSLFTEQLARDLVDDAGLKIGVGAFRPEKKGPFGRFKVVGWDQA